MAFRCKIVIGGLWVVAICLKRENPREMSKNKKKQERRNNFPKCGAGRYFLAILTATPITPAGSSFVGIRFGQFSVQNVCGNGVWFPVQVVRLGGRSGDVF